MRHGLAALLLLLMPVFPIPEPADGWEGTYGHRHYLIIRFDPDTYEQLVINEPGQYPRRFVAFTAKYPEWASQAMLTHPDTRIRLSRDYDMLSERPYNVGMYEGWLFLNGTDPNTGVPQRLVEGGTHPDYPGQVSGCAGIDLFPDRVRLVIAYFHLFPPGPRVAGEIVSERDEWRIHVTFGPRPDGDWYRCNADPEGTLGAVA